MANRIDTVTEQDIADRFGGYAIDPRNEVPLHAVRTGPDRVWQFPDAVSCIAFARSNYDRVRRTGLATIRSRG